jgi:hypothetical protein
VFLNSVAVDKVMAAALRTTAKNPVLPLAKDDRWYLLNAVLNELSEKFAQGWLQRDMGLPTRSAVYLICLTSECAGELKTRKIRAMVVQKDLLQNLPADLPADLPQFERPHHNTRWQTLQQMSALYATEPDHFLEVELALPVTNTIVRPSTPTPMPRGPSDRITVRT